MYLFLPDHLKLLYLNDQIKKMKASSLPQEVEKSLIQGLKKFDSKDFGDALKHFNDVIDKDKDKICFEARVLKIKTLEKLNRGQDKILPLLNEAILIKYPFDNLNLWYERAFFNWNRKDYDLAIKDLTMALKVYPDDIRSNYLLGKLKYEKKDWKEAITLFETVLYLEDIYKSFKVESWYYLGSSYLELDKIKEATYYFYRVIRVEKSYKNIEEKLKKLTEKLELNQLDILDKKFATGVLSLFKDEPEETLSAFEFLLESNSIDKTTGIMLKNDIALIFHNQGNSSKAINLLDELLQTPLGKKDPESLYLKGKIHFDMEKFEKAKVSLEKAVDLGLDTLELWLLLRDIYFEIPVAKRSWDHTKMLCERLKSVYRMDTEDIQNQYLVATAYYIQRRYSRALSICEKLLKIDPEWVEVWYLLGKIYEEKKSKNKATNAFKTAKELEEKRNK